MECKRCLAKDPKYFQDGICRRCIHLNYGLVERKFNQFSDQSEYSLNFKLTLYQKQISKKIVETIFKQDVFLEAVCGAGKTEMCYELLKVCIQNKTTIGWAIPRRQVVLELKDRIEKNFKYCKVIAVCGGHTDELLADVIICTTHQLFRYHQYFDILIVDEPDAFPFSRNELLMGLMKKSVKGHILFMSATKDESLIQELSNTSHLIMPLRPSLKPLPIPVHRKSYLFVFYDYFKHKNEKVLIFVPTIKLAQRLSILLRIPCITSQSQNKEKILENFKLNSRGKLICTTILERGMTFKNCFVFVFEAHHPVFDVSSLTQISGRVMRGDSTKGACYFYTREKCMEVKTCIENLIQTNQHAVSVLKKGI